MYKQRQAASGVQTWCQQRLLRRLSSAGIPEAVSFFTGRTDQLYFTQTKSRTPATSIDPFGNKHICMTQLIAGARSALLCMHLWCASRSVAHTATHIRSTAGVRKAVGLAVRGPDMVSAAASGSLARAHSSADYQWLHRSSQAKQWSPDNPEAKQHDTANTWCVH
jgi:hypothetical protein